MGGSGQDDIPRSTKEHRKSKQHLGVEGGVSSWNSARKKKHQKEQSLKWAKTPGGDEFIGGEPNGP